MRTYIYTHEAKRTFFVFGRLGMLTFATIHLSLSQPTYANTRHLFRC